MSIDGKGTPVEFAIEMTRFDESRTIDHLAEDGPLASNLIDAIADAIAASHLAAPLVTADPWIKSIPDIIVGNTTAFRAAAGFPERHIDELENASHLALSRTCGLRQRNRSAPRERIPARRLLGIFTKCLDNTPLAFFHKVIRWWSMPYSLTRPNEPPSATTQVSLVKELLSQHVAEQDDGSRIGAHVGRERSRLIAISSLSGTGKSVLAYPRSVRYSPDADRHGNAAQIPLSRAAPIGVKFVGLYLHTDLATRQRRVGTRGRDASDATPEIAALQEKYHIGAVDWTLIDVSRTPEQTLQLCLSAMMAFN